MAFTKKPAALQPPADPKADKAKPTWQDKLAEGMAMKSKKKK